MRIDLPCFLKFIVAIVIATSMQSQSQAAGKELPTEMMAVLQTDIRGFNTNNFALSNSQYVSNVVIIDETPPYRWEGPGAYARWWSDFRKLAKNIKLTKWHLSFQKPTYWEVSNDHAYIVLPATFTGIAGGKPFTETGTETYLMVKVGDRWMAEGWSYGKISMR